MFHIYFDKRILSVCSHADLCLRDANAVIFSPGSFPDLSDIAFTFEKNSRIPRLYIPSENEEKSYRQICSSFTQINAGGGLVMNKRGDYLMIYRNDLWDLPKGKQEQGEDIRESALREVEEECGISSLEMQELICITHHTYRYEGRFMLKHTYWYKMLYSQPTELIPQTEENISKAAWVAKSSLNKFLENTYPSIIEVFKAAHII